MTTYPAISDHGLIGDLQTAALVATDGTIDWFCVPRFDAPSVFASLLDHDRGGRFRIAPSNEEYVTKQLYFPDTAILTTRFMTLDGVGEVVDFMPIATPERPTDRHRIVRLVRVVRGEMEFVLECAPRFDYGRATHDIEATDRGVVSAPPSSSSPFVARSRSSGTEPMRAPHGAPAQGRSVGSSWSRRRAASSRSSNRTTSWTCSTQLFASGVSGSAIRHTMAAGRRPCTAQR